MTRSQVFGTPSERGGIATSPRTSPWTVASLCHSRRTLARPTSVTRGKLGNGHSRRNPIMHPSHAAARSSRSLASSTLSRFSLRGSLPPPRVLRQASIRFAGRSIVIVDRPSFPLSPFPRSAGKQAGLCALASVIHRRAAAITIFRRPDNAILPDKERRNVGVL